MSELISNLFQDYPYMTWAVVIIILGVILFLIFKRGGEILGNEQPRSKLRGINPNLVNSFAASGGEFDPKRLKFLLRNHQKYFNRFHRMPR